MLCCPDPSSHGNIPLLVSTALYFFADSRHITMAHTLFDLVATLDLVDAAVGKVAGHTCFTSMHHIAVPIHK